jgi:putative endonuclease
MLYVGVSVDLEQRLDDHVSGRACRTTALDPPVARLRVEVCSTFSEARQREAQLKRWSRPKKEALVCGDFDRLRKLSRSRESGGIFQLTQTALAVDGMLALVGTDLDAGDVGGREFQFNAIPGLVVTVHLGIDLPGIEMLDGETKHPAS